MDPEKLPYVTLAQAIVKETMELVEQEGIMIGEKERRVLLGKYSEILRPVCKAAEEAYKRGFDDTVPRSFLPKGQE